MNKPPAVAGRTAELPFSVQHLGLAAGLRAAMHRAPEKVAYTCDDLLPVVALGLLAGLAGPAAGRRAMLILPLAWVLGGLGGFASEVVPLPGLATAWSALVLGMMVAADRRWHAAVVPLFGDRPADPSVAVVRGVDGEALSRDALTAALLVAAHDAGIEQAQEVSPDALRHTYLAFLVRQGARFADITRWVGPLAPDVLSAYSQLAPTGARLEAGAVQRLFPALAQVQSQAA